MADFSPQKESITLYFHLEPGVPVIEATPLSLNVAPGPTASPNNTKYAEAAAYFAASVDPHRRPMRRLLRIHLFPIPYTNVL